MTEQDPDDNAHDDGEKAPGPDQNTVPVGVVLVPPVVSPTVAVHVEGASTASLTGLQLTVTAELR